MISKQRERKPRVLDAVRMSLRLVVFRSYALSVLFTFILQRQSAPHYEVPTDLRQSCHFVSLTKRKKKTACNSQKYFVTPSLRSFFSFFFSFSIICSALFHLQEFYPPRLACVTLEALPFRRNPSSPDYLAETHCCLLFRLYIRSSCPSP